MQNQINQVVVSDGLGGAFIAWQDGRSGGVNIWAQRVDTDGNMMWPDNGIIICSAPNDQGQLDMISDGNNSAIIVWQDNRNSNIDLYAQKVNSLGAVQWTLNGVTICNDASVQSPPKIVSDGNFGAFITWHDDRNGDNDIFVTKVDASGFVSPANGTQIGNNTAGLAQRNPVICTDGALGAILAYEQMSPTNSWDIYAQRINASCSILWIGGGVPACIAAYQQVNPRIANDGIGSAVIVWEDFINSANYDIYAQRVGSTPPSGAIQWAANGIMIKGGDYDQLSPEIVSVGLNSSVIVFQDFGNGTNWDLYAKKISGTTTPTLDWSGAPFYAEGVPVSTLQGGTNQINPQIVVDNDNGGVIIVWADDRNLLSTGWDIYAQHLDSAGSFKLEGVVNGYGICDFSGDQEFPMLTNNSPNDVVFAWRDTRDWPTLEYDIYTLGLDEDETLPVELSSFTAVVTSENYAKLQWVTQTETGVSGFYVYRSNSSVLNTSILVSPMISATNTSQESNYSFIDQEVEGNNTWYYWLQNIDLNGHSDFHGPINITLHDNVTPILPAMTEMTKAYPNPFNNITSITYLVSKSEDVKIEIYNLKGQVVRSLVSGTKNPGSYSLKWNGNNDKGRSVSSGVYYIRMTAGDYITTQKVMYIK
jgi:hypothetical protein